MRTSIRSPWPKLILLALVGVFCLYLLLAKSFDRESNELPIASPQAEGGPEHAGPVAPTLEVDEEAKAQELDLEVASEQGATERTPFAAKDISPLKGQVVSTAGPLGDVLLRWTVLNDTWNKYDRPRDLPLDEIQTATVETRSAADGSYRFDSLPAGFGEHPSVVWLAKPGFEAHCLGIGGPDQPTGMGDPLGDWPGVIELNKAPELSALVRRGKETVSGATVRQQLDFWDPGTDEETKARQRVFLFEAPTDEAGRVALVPAGVSMNVVACAGEDCSMDWFDTPSETEETLIELELLPPIRIRGIVRATGDIPLAKLKLYAAVFDQEDRMDIEWLGQSHTVGADGNFGPLNWYGPEKNFLGVRVSGEGIIPVFKTLAFPASREVPYVEFEVEMGQHLSVNTSTTEGTALAGVEVQAYLVEGASWQYLTRRNSDEKGHLELDGLPSGQIGVYASKPDFVSVQVDDERTMLPRLHEDPISLVLAGAGVVDFYVLREGEPAPAFNLMVWSEDESYLAYFAQEDPEGHVRLEDVPIDTKVFAYAHSDACPQSDIAQFSAKDEPTECVLELPKPYMAQGRVVDSISGEGIPTATIQHWTQASRMIGGPRGEPMPVDPKGEFLLPGFAAGRGGYRISAPGYNSEYYQTRDRDQDVIDLGVVALSPVTNIHITVTDAEALGFDGYMAWSDRSFDRTPLPLGADGTILLPTMAGTYIVHVRRPDGAIAERTGRVFGGQTEEVRVDFSGGLELLVALESLPSEVDKCVLEASAGSESRATTQAHWSADLKGFLLRGLQAGGVVLTLFDGDKQVLAMGRYTLDDSPRQQTTLVLSDASRQLRIVKGNGQPWVNKSIYLTLPDEFSGWTRRVQTDADGLVDCGPLPYDHLVLSARLGNEFTAFGISVDLEPDPKLITTVVLEQGPRCHLKLVEKQQPLAGLLATFWANGAPLESVFSYTSDKKGLIEGPQCVEDHSYRVFIDHPDVWPVRYEVFGRGPDHINELEIYHRAHLSIQIKNSIAQAAGGVAIELQHEAFQQTPLDWAQAGDIRPLPSGLVTDAEGRLELSGIPRGTYTWTLPHPPTSTGTPLSGKFTLEPGESKEVTIQL